VFWNCSNVPRKKYDQKINFCKLHFILQYFKLLYRIRGRLSYPVIVITILSTLYVHEEQDCNIRCYRIFFPPKMLVHITIALG